MNIIPFTTNDKLMKLLETNKLLTKSLDIHTILKTLVEAAEDLIDVADTVILYLYHPDEECLKIAEGVGIDKTVMKNISFKPGESLTGKTFVEKKSFLFSQEKEIKTHMSNISERNYYYYFKGVFQRQVKSAFCVPLLYQGACLGALMVDNFENDGYFTKDDMTIIEMIADQAAVAIINSNLVQNLKEKNEQLQHSLDIHKRFTEINLNGGGIDSILSLLARILQTEVFYQETKTTKSESDYYPIIRGKETLGYIELKRTVGSLSPLELVAIEHAATALSLELVKQNALYEKELDFRKELFQKMVEGVPLRELQQITKYLTWETHSEFECMVIEGKNEAFWKSSTLLDKEKFVKSIERISQSFCPYSLVFLKTFQIIMITPSIEKGISEKMARAVQEKLGQSKEIICGVGRPTSLHNLANSYQEALDAVRHGKAFNKSCVNYAKLGAERLWQKVDQMTLNFFVSDKLDPILALGDEYFETLSVLIESNRSHKKAAEILHIHPNTLYYRLKKIERTVDISFEDDNDWLNLMLAFNIYVATHK